MPHAAPRGSASPALPSLIATLCFALGVPGPFAAPMTFSEQTQAAGINHLHSRAASDSDGEAAWMSGAAAAEDFDNDGFVDLYVQQGGASANLLYMNDGMGGFVDRAAEWNADLQAPGMGVASADFDNDGDHDLVLTIRNGLPLLLENLGGASFAAPVTISFPGTHLSMMGASWGDANNDGLLELGIAQWATQPTNFWLLRLDEGTYKSYEFRAATNPDRPRVFAAIRGLRQRPARRSPPRRGFLALRALHEHGRRDLPPDDDNQRRLHRPERHGERHRRLRQRRRPRLVRLQHLRPQRRRGGELGNQRQSPLPQPRGTAPSRTSPRSSACATAIGGWGSSFGDLDLDGDLDLYHVNGWADPRASVGAKFNNQPARLFENRTDRDFDEVASASGAADSGQGRGLLLFDYDNDGDLDIYICNNQVLTIGPGATVTRDPRSFRSLPQRHGPRRPRLAEGAAGWRGADLPSRGDRLANLRLHGRRRFARCASCTPPPTSCRRSLDASPTSGWA
jgi:hypothetical protein